METNGLWGRLGWLMEWLMWLLWLDILWLGFSLLGLGVLGVFPSTAGVFAVTRKWAMGQTDVAVFPTFWKAYKQEFAKSNILGWIMLAVAYVLWVDTKFLNLHHGASTLILRLALLVIVIIYAFVSVYLFPVLVHYDIKTFRVFQYSFLMSVMHPFRTIGLVIVVSFVAFILRGMIPALAFSLICYFVMYTVYGAFKRIEERQKKNDETDSDAKEAQEPQV